MKRVPKRTQSPKTTLAKSRTSLVSNSKPRRVELAVFAEKGHLSSVSLFLKKDSAKKMIQFFSRKMHHSVMGALEESAFINRGNLSSCPSGKLEIKSKIHGPIGEIYFRKAREKNTTFFLHSLEVIPWARKEGFGGQIIASAIDLLKKQVGAKTIVLNVNRKNLDAINIYSSFGFKTEIYPLVGHLEKGEMQMSLKLKD